MKKLGLVWAVILTSAVAAIVVKAQDMKVKEKANRTKCVANQRQAPYVAPIEIKFDDSTDADDLAVGKTTLNLILKNPDSGQTITFDAKKIRDWIKPSYDKSQLYIFVTIDNLDQPIADDLAANVSASPNADGSGVDVTLSFVPKVATARAGPIKGAVIKGGCNRPCGTSNKTKRPGQPTYGDITFTVSEVDPISCEDAAARNVGHPSLIKMRQANAARRTPEILLASSEGTASPKRSIF